MRLTPSPDDDYEYIQSIFSRYPGALTWQDRDAKFLCASPDAMNVMGFGKFHEMFGRGPADMKNSLADLADALERKNQAIIEQNVSLVGLFSIYLPTDNWGLLLGQQQPLLNGIGEIIGVTSQAIDITKTPLASHFIHLFLNQDKKTAETKLEHGFYCYKNNYEKLNLSKRQAECFFWVIRKKTATEIGKLLGLNKRTVEDYLATVKNKFNVKTLGELIEYAQKAGLNHYIPKHWLVSSTTNN